MFHDSTLYARLVSSLGAHGGKVEHSIRRAAIGRFVEVGESQFQIASLQSPSNLSTVRIGIIPKYPKHHKKTKGGCQLQVDNYSHKSHTNTFGEFTIHQIALKSTYNHGVHSATPPHPTWTSIIPSSPHLVIPHLGIGPSEIDVSEAIVPQWIVVWRRRHKVGICRVQIHGSTQAWMLTLLSTFYRFHKQK